MVGFFFISMDSRLINLSPFGVVKLRLYWLPVARVFSNLSGKGEREKEWGGTEDKMFHVLQ